MMDGRGESDRPVVPTKSPNNAAQAAAEGMEGRASWLLPGSARSPWGSSVRLRPMLDAVLLLAAALADAIRARRPLLAEPSDSALDVLAQNGRRPCAETLCC